MVEKPHRLIIPMKIRNKLYCRVEHFAEASREQKGYCSQAYPLNRKVQLNQKREGYVIEKVYPNNG